jgi:pimeloyl-ACP methyl ester carboxylesterase
VLIALALLSLLLWTPDIDRATLEHQYLQSPADMVEVAGTRLHVRDSGPRDAPAVVLLHGFGASLHTWEAWVPGLAEHHRVIRFDLPGSGLSAPDPTGDYTDERSLEVLRELLDRLGLARASLVGHSMGGRIAWRFAARFADRVERSTARRRRCLRSCG